MNVFRIGLAVCRKLIDLMGGDILLDHEYDSGIQDLPGTRFTILLNRRPLKLEDTPLATNESSHSLCFSLAEAGIVGVDDLPEHCKVLFVDDDTMLRRLFVRSLQKLRPSWIISQAANGETALELTASNEYDFIFMDQVSIQAGDGKM